MEMIKAMLRIKRPDLPVVALIASLAVVAVCAVFAYAGVCRVRSLDSERAALALELERLAEVRDAVGRGEDVLATLEETLTQWERRIPTSMDFESFYSDFSALVDKHGIDVAQIQPSEVEETERHAKMSILITAESPFTDLYQFVRDVEALPRLTTLDRLDIHAVDDGKRCNFSLTLTIYAMHFEDASNG